MLRALITAFFSAILVVILTGPVIVISPVYRAQWISAYIARTWSRAVLWLAGAQLTVEGCEYIADGKPRFFMGNHQSALDIPILFHGLNGYVRFVAKKSLFRIPFFGWYLGLYGYVPIDRSNPRVAYQAMSRMLNDLQNNPASFAVFPEGTRSDDGRLLPFHRGTMKIGQRSGLDVVPFTIDGAAKVYNRKRVECRPGPVKLVFSRPITAAEVSAMNTSELHDRVHSVIAGQLGQRNKDQPVEELPVENAAMDSTGMMAAESR